MPCRLLFFSTHPLPLSPSLRRTPYGLFSSLYGWHSLVVVVLSVGSLDLRAHWSLSTTSTTWVDRGTGGSIRFGGTSSAQCTQEVAFAGRRCAFGWLLAADAIDIVDADALSSRPFQPYGWECCVWCPHCTSGPTVVRWSVVPTRHANKVVLGPRHDLPHIGRTPMSARSHLTHAALSAPPCSRTSPSVQWTCCPAWASKGKTHKEYRCRSNYSPRPKRHSQLLACLPT